MNKCFRLLVSLGFVISLEKEICRRFKTSFCKISSNDAIWAGYRFCFNLENALLIRYSLLLLLRWLQIDLSLVMRRVELSCFECCDR